ncbi:DUF6542 domain-containing protein [Rhodococcus spongiicola]|uniref:DUF6542 domain-containing protein n=1 Tax=Rhodococcus spongiicola TaxID=2487352 RepID=A0A3S3E5E9_9NOCA|nr:DUF6542 domain-containing protein [Rhodococcus spongiicola]RVW06169.1 hypothetical protein EF834_01535 [Rhodococcus spongiicola]
MSSTQRARSGVPLDQRSALPSVHGIPAWGAVAVAAGLTIIGFALDAASGSEQLTSKFSALYFLGCLVAVLAVRHRGLFTTVVQPPLLLFIAVPVGQQLLTNTNGASLKDLALNVAYPLVDRFPLMLAATVAVVLIAGVRKVMSRQSQGAPARSRASRASARATRGGTSADRREARTSAQDRRPAHDPTAPRTTYEPATARSNARGGYPEPVRRDRSRRDTAYSEPIARGREPIQRDSIPARGRPTMDVPSRPVTQVRNRGHREPPIDR